MRIVVTGWIAGFPNAGFFWHAASYALGFGSLGHEVWYIEDSGDYPYSWDEKSGQNDPSGRVGADFLRSEFEQVGLGDRWAYRHIPSGRHDGMSAEETADVLAEADVLVNVSCTTARRAEYERIPHRLAIDTDPVFTQLRIAQGSPEALMLPEWHTRLFTFGRPPLPGQRDVDEWVPTRQPVAVEHWPVLPAGDASLGFSTVTAWQAYPGTSWNGQVYGAKDMSFRELAALPSGVHCPLTVAVGGGDRQHEGREFLDAAGWSLYPAPSASRTTRALRTFIGSSLGEIGVAKHAYVVAKSGWFSERTCCYLVSGRPAVVQDTGWTSWLPSGSGLLAFHDTRSAQLAIEEVLADPDTHGLAARAVVEEHFEASKVCHDLLERL